MYVYKLREKSSGKFYNGVSLAGKLEVHPFGTVFSEKIQVIAVMRFLKIVRKQVTLYSNKGTHEEYAKRAKRLRPGNFEMVVYFCTEQK